MKNVRMMIYSGNELERVWISGEEISGVLNGLQQRFGKKLFKKRPTKAFLAGTEAIKKPLAKEATAVA